MTFGNIRTPTNVKITLPQQFVFYSYRCPFSSLRNLKVKENRTLIEVDPDTQGRETGPTTSDRNTSRHL